jgi:hypothetical protein
MCPPRPSALPALGVVLLALLVLGAGCASAPPSSRATGSSRSGAFFAGLLRKQEASAASRAPTAGELALRELRSQGVRLRAEEKPESIYAVMKEEARLVPVPDVRPGDLVFFDLGGGCGEHVGIVEAVEAGGRVQFREARAGVVRVSYLHPGQPGVRRDRGRLVNTFLRPKRKGDAPATRYHAGELLCGVGRAPLPAPATPVPTYAQPEKWTAPQAGVTGGT